MNKNLMFMLLLATSTALAEIKGPHNTTIRVAVYNPDEVTMQSKQWRKLMGDLDKSFEKQFEALKKEEEGMRSKATDLQKKANLISEQTMALEQEKLNRQKEDFDRKVQYAMKDYQNERQKIAGIFLGDLEKNVEVFAREQRFDILLPKSPGVFALAEVDQTNELVAHLNKQFDLSAGSKTAPLAKAKTA